MNEDEAEERTREGLADVDAGRVVDHQLVEIWAASLSDDVPMPVPGLNQDGK
jgi:predicted transcriptional regulator